MAKIEFSIEDHPQGGCIILSKPGMDEILERADKSPELITSAEAYAIQAWSMFQQLHNLANGLCPVHGADCPDQPGGQGGGGFGGLH